MFTGAEFGKESEHIYYAYCRKHSITDSTDSRTLFNAAFYLGAKYAMQTSTELSPHIARFLEFIMWLTDRSTDETSDSDLQPVQAENFLSPPY